MWLVIHVHDRSISGYAAFAVYTAGICGDQHLISHPLAFCIWRGTGRQRPCPAESYSSQRNVTSLL
jgi:hypothetical protein